MKLYILIFIEKIGELYFIVDCWYYCVIYNDNLIDFIKNWKILLNNIGDLYLIVSDGIFYFVEDV